MHGRSRWLAPHFGTVFFVVQLAAGIRHAGQWLSDPGTGWHLTTGRLILDTGAIPRHEPFSFTAQGRPWIDYYWLFDASAAWLVRLGGLPLYAAACLVLYSLVPLLLYRRMIRKGANPLAAFVVMPAAFLVLQTHAMARPHVITYVFLLLLLDGLDRIREHGASRTLLYTAALTALWCNLHPGFVAGIALAAVSAMVTGARWLWSRSPADRRAALRLAIATVSLLGATLLNPYGVHLLPAIGHDLGMKFAVHFIDFQSPPFSAPDSAVLAFELVLLGLIGTMAWSPARFPAVDVALALLTLHWALTAQRNMNVFVLVAAPLLASGLTAVLAAWRPRVAERWHAIGLRQSRLRSSWLYVPVASGLVLGAAAAGRFGFPTTLEGILLSRGAASYVAAAPERFRRSFNDDPLGGALIDRFWPALHVFVDDRGFVYGDDFMLRDYFTVLYGQPGWSAVLDRWRVESAILTAEAPCLTLFRASPAWQVAYEDDQNVLLTRRAPHTAGRVASP